MLPTRSVAAAAASVDQAAAVLEDPQWPDKFPFKPEYFQRCAALRAIELPRSAYSPRCSCLGAVGCCEPRLRATTASVAQHSTNSSAIRAMCALRAPDTVPTALSTHFQSLKYSACPPAP